MELSANHSVSDFSAYGNRRFRRHTASSGNWRNSNSIRPIFAYVYDQYIHLDQEGARGGLGWCSVPWQATRFNADSIFGTGLRQDLTLPAGKTAPNGDHVPSYTQVNLGLSHAFHLSGSSVLSTRFDVINVFDKIYQIRSGMGVGVFASQSDHGAASTADQPGRSEVRGNCGLCSREVGRWLSI